MEQNIDNIDIERLLKDLEVTKSRDAQRAEREIEVIRAEQEGFQKGIDLIIKCLQSTAYKKKEKKSVDSE